MLRGDDRHLGHRHLLVRQLVEQVEHRLVVNIGDLVEGDAFGGVQALLRLEGRHGKVALELLVGEVDAQLLEGVRLEDLEPEDIEDADETSDGLALGAHIPGALAARVDAPHDPVEEAGVQRGDEGVTVLLGGLCRHAALEVVASSLHTIRDHPAHERMAVGPEEPRRIVDDARVDELRAVVTVGGALCDELSVAQMKEGAEDVDHRGELVLAEPKHARGAHRVAPLGGVVDRGHLVAAGLCEHREVGSRRLADAQARLGRSVGAAQQLVKGVVVALPLGRPLDSGSLQQVVARVRPKDLTCERRRGPKAGEGERR